MARAWRARGGRISVISQDTKDACAAHLHQRLLKGFTRDLLHETGFDHSTCFYSERVVSLELQVDESKFDVLLWHEVPEGGEEETRRRGGSEEVRRRRGGEEEARRRGDEEEVRR